MVIQSGESRVVANEGQHDRIGGLDEQRTPPISPSADLPPENGVGPNVAHGSRGCVGLEPILLLCFRVRGLALHDWLAAWIPDAQPHDSPEIEQEAEKDHNQDEGIGRGHRETRTGLWL